MCILSTNSNSGLDETLEETLRATLEGDSILQQRHDPFVILSVIFHQISLLIEQAREELDLRICKKEASSGVAIHNYSADPYESVKTFSMRKVDLHKLETEVFMFLHLLEFQVHFGEFLIQQHQILQDLYQCKSQGEDGQHKVPSLSSGRTVKASLEVGLSMSRWRLAQVKVLSQRLQIQLQVVSVRCRHLPEQS